MTSMAKAERKDKIMTINLNNNVTIHNAIGEHDHWCSKPVICLNTGEVFISATDAAKSAGGRVSGVCDCCNGRIKTFKGKVYRYLSKTSENVDALVTQIRALHAKQVELEADAAVGRAQIDADYLAHMFSPPWRNSNSYRFYCTHPCAQRQGRKRKNCFQSMFLRAA